MGETGNPRLSIHSRKSGGTQKRASWPRALSCNARATSGWTSPREPIVESSTRMDFTRFNQYKEAPPSQDPGGWAWSPHGAWDSHIPEVYPYVRFSTQAVGGPARSSR